MPGAKKDSMPALPAAPIRVLQLREEIEAMQKDIQQSQARELNQILLSRLLIHVLEGVSDKLFSREYGKKFAQDVRAVMATRELDVYKVSEYLDNALNQLPRVDFEATVAGYMGKTEEDRDRIAALVEKMATDK